MKQNENARVTIDMSHADAVAFTSALSTLIGFARGVRLPSAKEIADDEPPWFTIPVALDASEMLAHRIRAATILAAGGSDE